MAVPRNKISLARKRKRRAHHGLAAAAFSACPACGAQKAPHCICAACGQYKGRQVVEIEEDYAV